MRGFLHRTKRNKANLVSLTHFFKRPAHARITSQPLAAIGRPFKGGNGDGHREAPPGKIIGAGLASCQGKFSGIEDDPAPRPVYPCQTSTACTFFSAIRIGAGYLLAQSAPQTLEEIIDGKNALVVMIVAVQFHPYVEIL
jgi:hypothetical protein